MTYPGAGSNIRRMTWSVAIRIVVAVGGAWVLSATLHARTVCTGCHSEAPSTLAGSPHEALIAEDGPGCGACHRHGAAHASAPPDPAGMITFDADQAEADRVCADCHSETAHPAGIHRRAGVNCTNCHGIHSPRPAPRPLPGFESMDSASTACQRCHQPVLSEFAFNESHRLARGSVGCTDCHDPHGPGRSRRLIGSERAMCADCHADKDGPFVFEHAASRVDGCLACHVPHGSPNRHLLTHQRVGELCYACHAVVPTFHFGFGAEAPPRFDLDTVCTNCHAAIHGSNLDRSFLR